MSKNKESEIDNRTEDYIAPEKLLQITDIIAETISNFADLEITINQIIDTCNEAREVEHSLIDIINDLLDFTLEILEDGNNFETSIEIAAISFFEDLMPFFY